MTVKYKVDEVNLITSLNSPLFQYLWVLLDEFLADLDVAAHGRQVERRVLGMILHVDVRVWHAKKLLDHLKF